MDLNAVLGQAEITVKDFLELNVGDVINLNTNIEEPIGVYVEEQLTYIGKPGLTWQKLEQFRY